MRVRSLGSFEKRAECDSALTTYPDFALHAFV